MTDELLRKRLDSLFSQYSSEEMKLRERYWQEEYPLKVIRNNRCNAAWKEYEAATKPLTEKLNKDSAALWDRYDAERAALEKELGYETP